VVGRRWICMGLLVLLAACAMDTVAAGAPARISVERSRGGPTALEVRAAGPPRYVYGSDGRGHVDYDLVVTNAFTAEVTLKSLTVSGAGRRLLRLAGPKLAAQTHQIIAGKPSARIPASGTVVTLVDVVLPRSAGRTVPRRLTNRVDYGVPPRAPFKALLGSTTVRGPVLETSRRAPVVIASPLRGAGWLAANACCDDPSSPHRNFVVSANGTFVTPEMFAIDWTQVLNGSLFRGAGTQLSDYPFFGTPIHAVANGTVISTVNNRPEVPPGESATGNPTIRKPADFGGNEIVERIAPGVYAGYDHLQTGSILVRRGQRVRTGQPIASLGNTGNTTAPHLHFGIQDGPKIVSSNSLPFEIDNFTLQGTISPTATATHIVIAGPKRKMRKSYPLIRSVLAFSPSPGG
jgi:hypothetical protein